MHAKDNHAVLPSFIPSLGWVKFLTSSTAVLYLQNATFRNGENIRVDGGVHAGR